MTDWPGQESNYVFPFKIEPAFIPATAIQRSGKFPNCRGAHGDVWKCYMSTQSDTRPVSLQEGELQRHDYLSRSTWRSQSNPSGSFRKQVCTVGFYPYSFVLISPCLPQIADMKILRSITRVKALSSSPLHLLIDLLTRGFVVKPTFGYNCSMTTFFLWRVLP
jgi:hypothetical protein